MFRSKSVTRIVTAILVVVLLVVCLSSCHGTAREPRETFLLPLVREGKQGTLEGCFAISYSFQSLWEESDLVIFGRVQSWLSEIAGDENGVHQTFHDVIVLETFKGKPSERIVMLQEGSSAYTYEHSPIYRHGEEMLLFLKEAVPYDSQPYEKSYWMPAGWPSALPVVKDDNNVRYALDFYYFIPNMGAEANIALDNYNDLYTQDGPKKETMLETLDRTMPDLASWLRENDDYVIPGVYRVDDILGQMR